MPNADVPNRGRAWFFVGCYDLWWLMVAVAKVVVVQAMVELTLGWWFAAFATVVI